MNDKQPVTVDWLSKVWPGANSEMASCGIWVAPFFPAPVNSELCLSDIGEVSALKTEDDKTVTVKHVRTMWRLEIRLDTGFTPLVEFVKDRGHLRRLLSELNGPKLLPEEIPVPTTTLETDETYKQIVDMLIAKTDKGLIEWASTPSVLYAWMSDSLGAKVELHKSGLTVSVHSHQAGLLFQFPGDPLLFELATRQCQQRALDQIMYVPRPVAQPEEIPVAPHE